MGRVAALPILVVLAVMVTGCGGGGGGSVAPVSDPVRQIQPGDELTYATQAEGDVMTTNITVTMVFSEDSAAPVYGDRRFKVDFAVYTTENGVISNEEPRRFVEYVEQDSDGTIYSIRGEHTPTNEVGKPVWIPGTLRVGDSFSYSCEYVEGGTYSRTTRVVGYENVDGYMAYKLHSDSVSHDLDGITNSSDSTDTWVVPEIGTEIKTQADLTYDGQHSSSVQRLIDRNY